QVPNVSVLWLQTDNERIAHSLQIELPPFNHSPNVIPGTFERLRLRLGTREPLLLSEPRAIEAAVALALVPIHDGDLELLFIQRAELAGDPWSGQMALPGGRRDADDLDLLATAIREAREETGIELLRDYLLGQLDEFAPRTPTLPPVIV